MDQPAYKLVSLNYGTQLGKRLSLNVSLLTTLSEPKSNSMMFFLTTPFNDRGGSAMLSANAQKGGVDQPTLQVQQSALGNGDVGYRGMWVGGNAPRQEAGVNLRTQKANYNAEASHVTAATSYRVGIQGALATLDGQVYASQRINQSFGVVHIPGYSDVKVLSNNQIVGQTNANGDVLLPDLYSYQTNFVDIDSLALPLDAQLASSKAILTPYYRSGVSTAFEIKRSRSAVLSLKLEDGQPAPVGMEVTVGGVAETFTVGMRGEVFVTDLQGTNKIQATWRGKTCQFDFLLPNNAETTVYADPITCAGVAR